MDAVFEPLRVEMTRDDWSSVRAASGRLPMRRSPWPRALEIAWRRLDAALRACPPGRGRVLALEWARGEHLALADAASRGALPHARPHELGAIRAYGRILAERATRAT